MPPPDRQAIAANEASAATRTTRGRAIERERDAAAARRRGTTARRRSANASALHRRERAGARERRPAPPAPAGRSPACAPPANLMRVASSRWRSRARPPPRADSSDRRRARTDADDRSGADAAAAVPRSGAIDGERAQDALGLARAPTAGRTSPPRTASPTLKPAAGQLDAERRRPARPRARTPPGRRPRPARCRARSSPRAPRRPRSRAPAACPGARSSASGCRADRRRGERRAGRGTRPGGWAPTVRPGAGRRRQPAQQRLGRGQPAPGRRTARPRRRPRACARHQPERELGRQPEARQPVAPALRHGVAVRRLLRAPGRQLQEVAALLDRAALDQVLDLDRERRQAPLPVLERDPHQVGRARVDRRRQHRAARAARRGPSSDRTPAGQEQGRPSSRTSGSRG